MEEKPVNLLLIEDDNNDIVVIKYFLWDGDSQERVKVSTAGNLKEGCKFLEDNSCDAVILDLGLPDSSGIGSFLKIRAQRPDLPVIVLTGLRDESVALEALALGAQDYLIKGMINGYFLRRAIAQAIARGKGRCHGNGALPSGMDGPP